MNLEHDKPDIVAIHVGSNNVSYKNLDIDVSILVESIIKIGNKCIDYGVEEVVISSIFVTESIRLTSLIRKVNDELGVLCSIITSILFQMITSLESVYLGMVHI